MKKKIIIQITAVAAVFAVTGVLAAVKYTSGSNAADQNAPQSALRSASSNAFAFGPMKADASLDTAKLRASGLPVLIDFGADWCAPCREFEPILRDLHKALDGKAVIKYVDITEYRDVAAQYPVQVVPTQLLFSADGKPFVPPENIMGDFKMYSSREDGSHLYTVHEGGFTREQMIQVLKAMGMKE